MDGTGFRRVPWPSIPTTHGLSVWGVDMKRLPVIMVMVAAASVVLAGTSLVLARGWAFQGEPTTPYQGEVLEDDTVTDEEMSAAVDATVACIAGKGFRVSRPPSGEGPEVDRTLLIVTDSPGADRAAVEECKREFMDRVELRYVEERDPRVPLPHEVIVDRFDECMGEKGFASAGSGDPVGFWTDERLTEAASAPGGYEATKACFDELSGYRPE